MLVCATRLNAISRSPSQFISGLLDWSLAPCAHRDSTAYQNVHVRGTRQAWWSPEVAC